MDRLLGAHGPVRQLRTAVGDDLVHVHIELCAAARNPHRQRKHVQVLPGQYLVADRHDQVAPLLVQLPGSAVGQRATFLQNRVRPDHLPGHQLAVYGEQRQRPLCLRTPQRLFRNPDLAQAVGLDSKHATSNVCFPSQYPIPEACSTQGLDFVGPSCGYVKLGPAPDPARGNPLRKGFPLDPLPNFLCRLRRRCGRGVRKCFAGVR